MTGVRTSDKSATDRPLRYRRGVGAVVFRGDGQVLVARRIDTPGEAWQLPQGGMRKGETPRHALYREVQEEIGTDKVQYLAESSAWLRYELPPDLAGRVRGGRYHGQEQRWFALRFTGIDSDIDVNATRKPEFDAWRWADYEDLPDLAVWFKRSLYAAVVDEFRDTAAMLRQMHEKMPESSGADA
ncbi:MAG: RNA pyrophosphohydrolase [Rhodospirillales bacterium]|nr:RNA pyrophosphohydrolase [Rhodospirillales bacterium]